MNDPAQPTLSDRLNNATSFRGASLAVIIGSLLTFFGTTQGAKILDRLIPEKSAAQTQAETNQAILKEIELIRWALFVQFAIKTTPTNGVSQ